MENYKIQLSNSELETLKEIIEDEFEKYKSARTITDSNDRKWVINDNLPIFESKVPQGYVDNLKNILQNLKELPF